MELATVTLHNSETEPPYYSETEPPYSASAVDFKVILVGESRVGKTSLAYRYIKGEFCESPPSVTGCIVFKRTVDLGETRIRFDIWETAGKERYECMAPMYYNGSDAAVVVYDVTNASSFQRAKWWANEVKKHTNPNITIALAGTKADLEKERQVEYRKAKAYATRKRLLFMETSAKTTINVNEIFLALAENRPAINPSEQVTNRSANEGCRCCCIS